jgi:anti-sigma factor RsiW
MEARPEENEAVDRLLRSSMAAPVPILPPDFEQRVQRAVRQESKPLDGPHRAILGGYGVVSALVSATVMRGQGLPWGFVTAFVLAPLVLIFVAYSAPRAFHAAAAHRTG